MVSPRGVRGRPVHPGQGAGPVLALDAPLSFWGGVDPRKGTVSDPRHPNYGADISGRVLVLPSAIGSSSSSAIMLELIREKNAPAAVVMGKADAILALGVVVAEELGYRGIPIVELRAADLEAVTRSARADVSPDGVIALTPGG